jgi:HEAT repeat protein
VREQAVNVLARRKDPGAIQTVIRAAKADKNPKVRRQAVAALARSKDPAAVRFFEDVFK